MTAGVLVVGDIVTDVVAIVTGPIAHASDTAASIAVTGGGAGANTAAWLAAAGVDVTLCGVVGADDEGAARRAELEAHGVRCAVRSAAGARTGSIVVIAERTERTMLADRGANLLLEPADVDAAVAAAGCVHLHLSGYPLLDAQSHAAAAHALAEARRRGWTTSVDAASAGPLRRAPGFLDWVRGSDVLFANADEAEVLVGAPAPPAELAAALAKQVRVAVVKLGAAGALACVDSSVIEVPAVAAEAVDATGAGDAFAAGFLAAYLRQEGLAAALAAGTELGARAVSTVGARPVRRA